MNTYTRTAAAFVVAGSLLLFTGCGSSAPADEDSSSEVDDSANTSDDPMDESTDDMADDTTDGEEEADAGPAGGAVYTDPASDSLAVTVSESGFDPNSISVPAGGTVTFTGGDDGPHGLYVGDLDGYSVMGGLTATFRFDVPGTYRVYDEISEASATVTVD